MLPTARDASMLIDTIADNSNKHCFDLQHEIKFLNITDTIQFSHAIFQQCVERHNIINWITRDKVKHKKGHRSHAPV
jgi:hypothetical protein